MPPWLSNASSPSRRPSWKISTSRPRRRCTVSRFITSDLMRQDHRPGQDEQDDHRHDREQRRGRAVVVGDAGLLVDELCGWPGHRHRERGAACSADVLHQLERPIVQVGEAGHDVHSAIRSPPGAPAGAAFATFGSWRSRARSRRTCAVGRVPAPRRPRDAGGSWLAGKSSWSVGVDRRTVSSSGSTVTSTPVNSMRRNGSPSRISSAAAAIAIGSGRRITSRDSRYQNPLLSSPRLPSSGRC